MRRLLISSSTSTFWHLLNEMMMMVRAADAAKPGPNSDISVTSKWTTTVGEILEKWTKRRPPMTALTLSGFPLFFFSPEL